MALAERLVVADLPAAGRGADAPVPSVFQLIRCARCVVGTGREGREVCVLNLDGSGVAARSRRRLKLFLSLADGSGGSGELLHLRRRADIVEQGLSGSDGSLQRRAPTGGSTGIGLVGQCGVGSLDGSFQVIDRCIQGDDIVAGTSEGIHLVEQQLRLLLVHQVALQHVAVGIDDEQRGVVDGLGTVYGTLQRVEAPIVGVQFCGIAGQTLAQVILLHGESRQLLTERSLFRRDAQLAHLRVAQAVATALAADLGEVEAHLDLLAFLHLGNMVVGLPVVAAQGVVLERQ